MFYWAVIFDSNMRLEGASHVSVSDQRLLADDLADEEPAEDLSCDCSVQHRLLHITQAIKFLLSQNNVRLVQNYLN